ncbi:MAG: hypothetical protein KC656_15495, partial [Myxococcales bacterium]|nr:hypothetical protein [Myxococcales bacterium]
MTRLALVLALALPAAARAADLHLGSPVAGDPVTVWVDGVPGEAVTVFVGGSAAGCTPLVPGPCLDLIGAQPVITGSIGPVGTATLTFAVPATLAGQTAHWQATVGGDITAVRTTVVANAGADTDGDGLLDVDEPAQGATVGMFDSDGDGLSDGEEVHRHGTSPGNADTDGGTVDDGTEVMNGLDPLNPSDDAALGPDADGDGLPDALEWTLGTDMWTPDTDWDGLTDGAEYFVHGTSPTNPDSDGDGLPDSDELFVYLTDPMSWDTDGGGADDGTEVGSSTDPLN